MRWLLKSPLDQNYHLINHTPNSDFKSHLIFLWTLNVHIKLLFYITLIIFFITIQIKKFTTILFHFFIQFFSTLYHINHFILLLKKKSTQQSLPNTPTLTSECYTPH
jgi:hypothetical protein